MERVGEGSCARLFCSAIQNCLFKIVNFPFLDGDVRRSPSYGVYISQLISFARVCSNVDDFENRNLFLTAKLFNKLIDIIKFENHFLNSTTDTQTLG